MDPQNLKRKLTAVFSTDVAGYSRLMGEDELATVETLTSYKQTMRNLIRHYRGRVVDSTGDNLLAEFASVVDAVQCAVEVQQVLRTKNESLPENRRMHFRIGINLGDVIEEGEVLYGDGVNIAARVESLADPGGICISGSAFEQIENKLALGYQYMGEHAVKNIVKPIKIYKVPMEPGAIVAVKGGKALGRKKWAIAAVAILVIAGAVLALWRYYWRPVARPIEVASVEKMAHPLPDKPSIAVLPFDNLSGDPEQEYFSDGMSEDVITDLSKIPGLLVISRYSSFSYKGKFVKIQKIAEELGVRYLLEGSVRKANNEVRINAQLIDGTTGNHLWAERYNGNTSDIFDLQDKITGKIVASLALKLTRSEQERLEQKETNNIDAYEAFLKGSSLADPEYIDANRFAEAIPWFKKAIELDPNYSRVYAVLAETYFYGLHVGLHRKLGISPRLAKIRAYDYLQKALKNPTNMAHRAAMWKYAYEWQHEKAVDHAMQAIALNPSDRLSLSAVIFALSWAGRSDEAVDVLKRMRRADPACVF
jgi:adenylate cyclase